MTNVNRLSSMLTAASVLAVVSGCSAPQYGHARSASIFGGKVDKDNIGLATRAQFALASNDVQSAVSLAERAVENSPKDAGFRALLGNSYLAAGRFRSAEAAYRDSLSLVGNQPKIILKLALVYSAMGRHRDAIGLLQQGQSVLDPTDLGLALTLAGDPKNAVMVLEQAARQPGADSRTRQNLALAHGFAGDWVEARVIAAQDVPANELDGRIQQWMALSAPKHQYDQVAAFIGIQPIAQDPGQPVRLALNASKDEVRYAEAEPMPDPAVTAGLTAQASVDLTTSMAMHGPAETVAAEPQPELAAAPAPQPVVMAASAPVSPHTDPLMPKLDAGLSYVAEAAPQPAIAPSHAPVQDHAVAARVPQARIAPVPAPQARTVVARTSQARLAEMFRPAAQPVTAGKSQWVVQLGAYSKRQGVELGWNRASTRFSSVGQMTPVSARYDVSRGATLYRLAVRGFAGEDAARNFCSNLKRQGHDCFVRSVAGDSPVQFASR